MIQLTISITFINQIIPLHGIINSVYIQHTINAAYVDEAYANKRPKLSDNHNSIGSIFADECVTNRLMHIVWKRRHVYL